MEGPFQIKKRPPHFSLDFVRWGGLGNMSFSLKDVYECNAYSSVNLLFFKMTK